MNNDKPEYIYYSPLKNRFLICYVNAKSIWQWPDKFYWYKIGLL